MPSTKPELVTSVESVRAIAIFFHELTHRLEPEDRRQGADVVKIATKRGLKIPSALDGFSIKYDAKPHIVSKSDLRRTIVVELPPQTVTAKARTISGCFDAGKGPIKAKVCVSCTITWTSITCKITITVTVGF